MDKEKVWCEMNLKQCRDCHRLIPKQKKLCPDCKKKAEERNKATHLALQKKYQAAKRSKPHKCLMCDNTVTGRAKYCADCRKARQAEHMKKHYQTANHTGKKKKKCSTGMAWMDNFLPWMQSGKSYAEFQKGEWLTRQ